MSSNLNFINSTVSRATLYRSRLPTGSTRAQHLLNNLANRPNTKLLHLGQDLSYVLYENDHIQEITWIDEDTSKTGLDSIVFKSEYSLIISNQHMFRTGMLKMLSDKLVKAPVLCILQTRFYDSQKIIDRSISIIDDLKVVSKLEIRDRNNANGFGDGLVIYDLLKT
ncbi:hypothetical protein PBCVNEJV1_641R [Paramecium bursaria Chlorella virus NE-JV-1]|nr:hypothetical protein PBCVNEJV1_641R [Paramecium bursaria Chlorella virus NE-JV-1]